MYLPIFYTVVKAFSLKALDEVFTWGVNCINEPTSKTRKKNDVTLFTQYTYDFVCREHTIWKNSTNNTLHGIHYATQKDLCEYFNKELGLSKCASSYARVFNGHVDRNTLAKGIHIDEHV